ncbi:MAG TPA: amino acid adenylation domain-containing protein [Thermoanaerobaculia bacterium]|nr:amino acid adenylation domain-containing protein [Thermoanaerobaculia bacterium]
MVVADERPVLSREEQLERVWAMAEGVLGSYGLGAARIKLLEQKKNITFRVDEPVEGEEPRRFVLRVCEIGEGGYDETEIRSELQYLRALSRATGLLVPDPVAALDGSLTIRGEVEGMPPRFCALFRWVPGRMVEDAPTPRLLERVGELSARIHLFSETFVPPPGFSRPRWDAARLFGTGRVLAPGQGEPLISDRGRELLEEAAQAVREAMAGLGEGSDVFGIIHKDLEPDNTLIDGDEVHAIDFADLGWGHYLYDIAASLLPLREKQGFNAMRDAFLRGYKQVRPLRPEHEALVETFLIGRSIFSVRLMTGKLWDFPPIREYANTAVPQILGGIRQFLAQRSRGEGAAAPRPETAATRTTVQFLSLLRDKGIKLWTEGEKLRFSAPQGTMTPALTAELKDRKFELLSFLRQGHVGRRSSAPTRVVTPEMENIPLSFAQQRLWFIDRLVPDSPQYNIARAVSLKGPVRVPVLAASLDEVVRRHAALRTTFAEVDGQPVQRIVPSLRVPLPVIDLQGLPAQLREPEAWRVAKDDARRPFDLARGPLLRVMLLRLAPEDHMAPSTMHHIVGDGWSSAALFGEMGALYTAFVRGEPSPLPELPIQYADFAVWQRGWLQGEVLEEQLSYWKEQLAGAPHLELPTDRPRSLLRSSDGDRHALLVPADLSASLRGFAQAQGATMFMILLAAFETVLARWSGQDDVVVGSPIASRNRTEIEALIGFFANTLVLRTRMPGDPTFREVLAAVRKTTLGAYAHQDLPFEKIVEELRPDRTASDTPFFQVVFTLQNVPYPDMQVSDFRMTLMPPTSRAALFDLTCNMKEMPEGVRTSFMYKMDLFDAATVARLAGQYLRVLEAVAADPGLRLGELPLLGPGERHQVVHEWSGAGPAAGTLTIPGLFASQAAARPDAVALAWDGGELTYGELARRTGLLARRLRVLGVGPEVPVGLSMERSAWAVTAILAVLQAGGFYVPLDPSYPPERLALLAADAGVKLLLTEEDVVRLEEETDSDEDLPEIDAGNLAYVMFTSGSTGRPKGVAVPHRGVVRLVREATYARLGPDEVLALFAPLSFDASTFEIWGALLNGGRLVIPPPGRVSLEDLGRTLDRFGVTTLWLTAGLFHQMDDVPTVRQLLAGGDVLSPAHVQSVLAAHPGLTLINGYGPTENTTFTCCYAMTDAATVSPVLPVPIGHPVGGTRVHLLDRAFRPVAPGVPGELYAGGDGLARGYVGRPDLTAERFVPDPVSGIPGARLYRTGDLARFRADGTIDFLGRIDLQVKIRGFRIEPGEIEAALLGHPAVEEAVVLVREEAPGDKRLAAYVKARPGEAPDLREFLKRTLPEFMVPAELVLVDAFPLTPNGKVDRAALARLRPDSAPEGPPPLDPVEELLAGIWAEVLRRESVGRDDDFFAVGGHSLLATQVVSRVREAFGVELPLQSLFEAPTVAALAAEVKAARREGRAPQAPPVRPVPRGGDLPLSFAQQRLWFLDRYEPGSAAYNIAAGVRLSGELRPDVLERAAAEVVRRHEALRTTFTAVGGLPVQVIAAGPGLALPLADLRALPPARRQAEARRLAAAEARRPFDLAAGPLFRAALLRLDEREHAALVTFHHIVFDGWSLGIFLGELAALYAAFAAGAASPLPELPVQYADFAHWQRQWLGGEVLEAELAYWRRQLAALPPGLELPADRPRPALQSFRGTSLPIALPPELSAALGRLGRQAGVTPFMTLLAAFQILLGRLARTADVAVGTPIAGRNRRETERLIGFFVNTLVLRTDLGGDPPVRELLARVRRTSLDAYAHQDVPFERLVEELQPERDLSRNPLFQVLFALQNAPDAAFDLPGLSLRPLAEAAGETAKLDLSLSLYEGEGGLRGSLELDTDLFDAATAGRWLDGFREILEALAAGPERRLSELPWLSAAERRQVLLDGGAGDTAGAADTSLNGLIAAQAARTPDAVAVVHGGLALTYGALERRAARLARHLRALGVGPEERAGVCLERGLDLVVALLAVLKAGGAYVPLDPAYPAERRDFMAEDSGARVVLTPERLLRDAAAIAAQDDGPLPELAAPGNLAYVIYTSGSTGRPKGVAIEHRSAVALARWARAAFSDEELSAVLASTSVCFDVSVFELFVPLAWGGRVIVVENALDLAAAGEVKVLTTVPSAMAELVRQDALPASVRTVGLGGEPVPAALAERIFARRPDLRLLNLYGPSEDTTYSTVALLAPGSGEPGIGRPVTGTRGYVLDERMEPVPAGVPGELFLGGEGLSRGYLGRPDLTAERFVPNPFDEPGARLYRTGDLVRRPPGGELRYLGRTDHQVKIRGFRVELGEIEAALGRDPRVREAAVLVREDRPGDRRLVAYVAAEGEAPPAGALRQALKERLPDSMVPAEIVFLPALPQTPNGKLDRRALAAISPDRGAGEILDAPRDATEEILAAIWAEVLGRERVGVGESFFEIGGHSLLATQVVSRVREAFAVDLPLAGLFAAPTVAGLAELVRAARGTGEGLALPPIVPVPRGAGLPLSFAQQRLWFLDRLQPGGAAYNIPAALRVRGAVSPAGLERVLRQVARRHESLRTVFAAGPDGPVQVIMAEPRLDLPLIDLSGLPEPRREEEALLLAGEAAGRPFDLEAGPLIRAALLRLAGEEHGVHHVVLLALHHIVADGWSIGVLFRELAALFGGEPLPQLAVQYADFAHWQRQWLAGDALAAELAHWRRRLEDAPHTLGLPLDRPRPAVQTFGGAALSGTLPAAVRAALAALARREGATLYMVLLAAFQALLGVWSGQDDLLIGSPIAGRNRRETEGLIGCFVNTLVLRADLGGDPTFGELLARVRATALDAYAHQDLPLELLVEELRPARDLSRNPLFQAVFALQNAPAAELTLPDLELRLLELPSRTAKFDLSLTAAETREGLDLSLEYNGALFEESTVSMILNHLLAILESALPAPSMRLSGLPSWRQPEVWQALAEPEDSEGCVHERIARWARETPDAPAVVSADGTLSYAELDGRAARLARSLRALGVGPEVLVAVCLPRSPEEVVALLAVLKAGGAYLPVEPGSPRERLAAIFADAGVELLLTSDALAPDLAGTGPRVFAVGREAGLDGGDLPTVDEDNLAYVIYTSGSTGRPKGVEIEHRALSRLIAWHLRAFGVTPRDRATRLSGLGFDASVWELWPYLAAGASVYVPPAEEVRTSPEALRGWLLAESITVSFVPTPVAEGMLALEWPAETPLRLLLTGGDTLHRHPPAGLPFRLVNNYGPTESTVVATSGTVPAAEAGAPSIGEPVDGVRVVLADRRLRPVPPGVAGELCLGGGSLARGYRGRPDLTAESFVPAEGGGRLYRTGDLARWPAHGGIEFAGRLDDQVKVRGVRVEPGEVAAALARHPGVRDCVVVARTDGPGGLRLVAYHAPAPAAPTAQELREFLRERLPDAMIPAAFVSLETLPLTPNGKVDRRALPAPGREDLGAGAEERAAPRDAVELELCRVWEELLGVAPVGVRDDFFALGGHSLLAVRLMGRIRERFGRELPLTALFAGATVEHLASLLRDPLDGEARRDALVPIRTGGALPPLFLVHPVGGNVLCYAELARQLDPLDMGRPVYAFQSPGPMESVEEMAAHYLEGVRAVQPRGPVFLAGWSMGGVVAFEMARRLAAEGRQPALLAVIDAFAPGTGPALSGPVDDGDLKKLFERDQEGLGAAVTEAPRLFEIFRANATALQRYAGARYEGRVTLLRAGETAPAGDDLGWSALAAGGAEVLEVPGHHYTLLRGAGAQRTAALLSARMNHD